MKSEEAELGKDEGGSLRNISGRMASTESLLS